MRTVSAMLALAVSLMLVGNLLADEEKKGPECKHPRHATMEPWQMLKGLCLTDDQKAKLDELKKEYGPRLKEYRENMQSILTEDQKKARAEAVKAAKAAGKKGDEVWKEAKAAVKATDEQRVKMADARKSMQALHKEIHEKVVAILTPEQKAQLKEKREHWKEHKPEAK